MAGRRVRRAVAAVVRTAVALAVVAGLATAGLWWPRGADEPARALDVEVSAGRAELVCAGPPRLQSDDAGLDFDRQFDPAPEGSTTVVEAFSLARGEGFAAEGGYIEGLQPDRRASARLGPPGFASAHLRLPGAGRVGRLTAAPAGDGVGLLAGATLARTDAGDLRGLAGSRCVEAAPSAWLFAGSTELGSSSRLLLGNPGATPATVSIEAWGRLGPVALGQAASVIVPARSERAVLLEAFAPDEPSLVLRLTVDGGEVAALVQDSALDGFVPAGVDLVSPAVEPATTVLVPGVVLEETDIDTAQAARLRVVNPGAEPAEVALRLLHTGGEVTVPGALTVVVEAGTVADVSLGGLPAGSYTAELVSDRPVSAAALLTRIGRLSADDPDTRLVDRAWVPAVLPSTGLSLLTLPGLGEEVDTASVVVGNPGEADLDLELRAVLPGGGVAGPERLTVPARSSAVVDAADLGAARGLVLTAAQAPDGSPSPGFVAAALLLADAADGPLLTVLSAQPDLEESRVVAVRLPHR